LALTCQDFTVLLGNIEMIENRLTIELPGHIGGGKINQPVV
jgi:hypothetical protein